MLFFQDWWSIFRILISAVTIYLLLILLLRISGKRTLSDMNIFDFVITVAIGTTFSSTIISKDVTILDGLLALGLLIFLQFMIAWITVRFSWVQRIIKSRPSIVFLNGEFQYTAMKKERVSKEEILQAMRSQGVRLEEQVEAVVLETNGNFSVLQKTDTKGTSTLEHLPM